MANWPDPADDSLWDDLGEPLDAPEPVKWPDPADPSVWDDEGEPLK